MTIHPYPFGRLRINPAKNPALLDTATWDGSAALALLQSVAAQTWSATRVALDSEGPLPMDDRVEFFRGSWVRRGAGDWLLARLGDGQYALLAFGGPQDDGGLGSPLGAMVLPGGTQLAVFPADADSLEKFVHKLARGKGPVALGAIPRLGIGARMSTSVWPGVWPALARMNLAANAIQNSLRELNLLEDLLAGHPARSNYMFGFGTLCEGHAGSTFEGLWLAGVLAALESDHRVRYGADADHIMVKRTAEGLERAKRVIDAARRYTFFTLDVSDILHYDALMTGRQASLAATIPDAQERRDVLAYHTDPGRPGGSISEQALARVADKHWAALSAVASLTSHIRNLKGENAFDLELSIDETPPGVRTWDCMTTEEELAFLLAEIRRRQLPITHIAPNFGVEKGSDYGAPGGLPELEQRVRRLHQLASVFGIMLDCHSGDDLSAATRRVFGRATGGSLHFKISPSLQALFAEVLYEVCPERFLFWWEDTMDYVRREAAAGSELAQRCLRHYEEAGVNRRPGPAHSLFQYYCFASVGRRDADGQFVHREKFYDLPSPFYLEYARRVTDRLIEVAADLFHPTS